MTDTDDRLDRIGRFLMENLRDPGLHYWEVLAAGGWKAPSDQELQAVIAELSDETKNVVGRCVAAAMDHAIHDFLFKLAETADFADDIRLTVDGASVAPLSDGLHGEPYGEDGWIRRFSRYPSREERD